MARGKWGGSFARVSYATKVRFTICCKRGGRKKDRQAYL